MKNLIPLLGAVLCFCMASSGAQEVADNAAPAVVQQNASTDVRTESPPSTCKKPEYPLASLRWEEQGAVTLGFFINIDGVVEASKIIRSSGYKALDEAARVALAKCRFKPASENGKPVAGWAPVQYVWQLRD